MAGLIAVNCRPQSAQWALLWVFASFAAFAVAYNTADSDAYLIPSFVAFAFWMGWSVAALLDVLRVANSWWQPVAVAALALATFANAIPAMAGVPTPHGTARQRHTVKRCCTPRRRKPSL